jgi:hypothetical protein
LSVTLEEPISLPPVVVSVSVGAGNGGAFRPSIPILAIRESKEGGSEMHQGYYVGEVSVEVAALHSNGREAGGFERGQGQAKIPASWDSPAVAARVWDKHELLRKRSKEGRVWE